MNKVLIHILEREDSKPVDKPAKRYYTYVKLDALDDNTIAVAKECVVIRVHELLHVPR